MPKTSRSLTVHPITLRELEVKRIRDLGPAMRRITLTGAQLRAFTSANELAQSEFRSGGFDDDVRLIFPYPGKSEPVLPVQDEAHLDWPKDPRALSRVYTVRRWDHTAQELDIDFVKHGTGIATSWAYRAQPGDRIHLTSPAASQALPETDWLLVAGDDTAIPAISRLLEELPEDAIAQVYIEVSRREHQLELRTLPGVKVTWLVRDGAPAGSTTLLLDAVRGTDWLDGTPYAWIAGESAAVKDIRRHLVEHRGMPKTDVEFTGYWRNSEVITLADDPGLPDPERNEEAFERFHELADLLPPLAIRAAVVLGLPELLSRGVSDVTELAVQSGSDPRALGKLMRYFDALGIVSQTMPGSYRLTDVGDIFLEEFVEDALHRDGAFGRRETSLFGLVDALRTGRESFSLVNGQPYAEFRNQQEHTNVFLDQIAKFSRYLAEPLAQSPSLNDLSTVTVRSSAAGVIGQAIVSHHPHTRVTIAGLPSQLEWFQADLPDSIPDPQQRERVRFVESSLFDSTQAADAVLFNWELAAYQQADAALILRRAAESLTPGGRVLVIEGVMDTGEADEHAAGDDLRHFALLGTGLRTEAELIDLFDNAGLKVETTEVVGWGDKLFRLAPTDAS
ncbi:SIP domain-containing protein [Microbacterium sp.]|uniref:SIP domain-containing protein n=1 Tax=Microbacterium sp. TaxID=51671 RepID=UPI003F944F35